MFSEIANFFSSPDLAIDLGTANTRLFVHGKGLVADVPPAMSRTRRNKRLDSNPTALNGRGGKSKFITPVRGGAVVDVVAASHLLKHLLKRINHFGFTRSRVIICAPTCLSDRERSAMVEAARLAGARAVAVVPAPLAAAVGDGQEICSPYAQMTVDIGDVGHSVALIRDGNLIQTVATRVAESELHKAVQKMVAERYQIRLSGKMAEDLTIKLGAAHGQPLPDSMKIRGVTDDGREIPLMIESREITGAIKSVVDIIVATVCRALRGMSPEAGAEVVVTGICLTGGVALLPGIADLIAEKTDLPVFLAPSPLRSVIDGAGMMPDVSGKTNLWQS